MSKIGLFSGTFDPIHVGHVKACLAAKAACGLEQVLVLIEQKPHRKRGVTSYNKRRDMVELALADLTLINFFDTHEPNITFKGTLPILQKRFPSSTFVMIVGSDILSHLATWDFDTKVELCIVLKAEEKLPDIKKGVAVLKKQHPKLVVTILPAVDTASSSRVRLDLKKQGSSDALHRNVIAYIKQQKLYALASSSLTSK